LNQILRRQPSRSHYGSKVPAAKILPKYIPSLQKKLKAVHFHIVKMYKDKEVKNVKDIFFVNV
jgi:hypothetical protein